MAGKYSVLGDSISTLKGYTVNEGCFYGHYWCTKGGIKDVHDTWWMRVIDQCEGVLEKNNSFMGSCVTPGYGFGASGVERATDLGEPDVVLVAMGANDAEFAVPVEDFEKAYETMLEKLKTRHPKAVLCCATPMEGKKVLEDVEQFAPPTGKKEPVEAYIEVIKKVVLKEKAVLIDLASHDEIYDAIDGAHPTKEGMKLISDLFLLEMKKSALY